LIGIGPSEIGWFGADNSGSVLLPRPKIATYPKRLAREAKCGELRSLGDSCAAVDFVSCPCYPDVLVGDIFGVRVEDEIIKQT
jgi:hypothetical protein